MMRVYRRTAGIKKKMRKFACALALAAAHGLPAVRSRVEECADTKDWKASAYKCGGGKTVGPKCETKPKH